MFVDAAPALTDTVRDASDYHVWKSCFKSEDIWLHAGGVFSHAMIHIQNVSLKRKKNVMPKNLIVCLDLCIHPSIHPSLYPILFDQLIIRCLSLLVRLMIKYISIHPNNTLLLRAGTCIGNINVSFVCVEINFSVLIILYMVYSLFMISYLFTGPNIRSKYD